MVGVAVIGLIGGMGCTVFAILAGQHYGADLRAALFRKVQSFSFGNLDRLETGALITRLTNDVTQLQELVMIMLRIMVRVPLLLVGSLIMAILTSPQLSLLFVVLIPLLLVFLVIIIARTFPLFGEVQRRLDTLNTVLQENLAGVRVVKAFARAAHEIGRFGRANDSLTEQNIKAVRITAVTMPFMMLTLNVGLVAALWFGGVRVTEGSLEIGQLIAFINYLIADADVADEDQHADRARGTRRGVGAARRGSAASAARYSPSRCAHHDRAARAHRVRECKLFLRCRRA